MSFEPVNLKINTPVQGTFFSKNKDSSESYVPLRQKKERQEEKETHDIFYSNEEPDIDILDEIKDTSILTLLIDFLKSIINIIFNFIGIKYKFN